MILFMRRSGLEGEDPYVGLKMLLFAVGAVMALGGMLLGWTWLVAVAMVVLVVAFAVRFMPARAAKDNAAPPD